MFVLNAPVKEAFTPPYPGDYLLTHLPCAHYPHYFNHTLNRNFSSEDDGSDDFETKSFYLEQLNTLRTDLSADWTLIYQGDSNSHVSKVFNYLTLNFERNRYLGFLTNKCSACVPWGER